MKKNERHTVVYREKGYSYYLGIGKVRSSRNDTFEIASTRLVRIQDLI